METFHGLSFLVTFKVRAYVVYRATPVSHQTPSLTHMHIFLSFSLSSFDVGSCFAGEVRDPERVFPRAMFLSVVFVVLSYILPLAIALGATDSTQEQWTAGFLVTAAKNIGGHWLGVWTVFAAAISNLALFEAEMSGDAVG